jgi:glycosyltransferase involved in cell wall biosynthesis
LEQKYDHTELLVVEDGTDSRTETWLHGLALEQARYIRHDTNRGLAAARNTGIQEAQGSYVAFLDDDDEWKPHRLERQVDLLKTLSQEDRDRLGVIYCPVETRYSDHVHVGTVDELNQGNLRRAILEQGKLTITPSSGLFAVKALYEVGGFDETLASSIDHDIWMSLANEGYDARVVDEPLVVNDKTGEESMVTNVEQRIRGIRQFVDKWKPVFVDWLGPDEGHRFAQRYLVRVLGKLLRDSLSNQNWSEGRYTLSIMLQEGRLSRYTLWCSMRSVLAGLFATLPRRYRVRLQTPFQCDDTRSSKPTQSAGGG